jgi:plastocyanin
MLLMLALQACGGDKTTTPPQFGADTALVSMPGFSFVPFTTSIKVGTVVVFDFPSESHNVIFKRITGAPTDIQETTHKLVARTFSTAGSFPYDCTIHPGMSGVIEVH